MIGESRDVGDDGAENEDDDERGGDGDGDGDDDERADVGDDGKIDGGEGGSSEGEGSLSFLLLIPLSSTPPATTSFVIM